MSFYAVELRRMPACSSNSQSIGFAAPSRASDHAASHSISRAPGGLRFVIVRILVHDDALADDIARAAFEADEIELNGKDRVAACIGFEDRQVAGMAVRCHPAAVLCLERIEMAPGAQRVVTAAIPVFVDIESMRTPP